jgi:hypothetical protein
MTMKAHQLSHGTISSLDRAASRSLGRLGYRHKPLPAPTTLPTLRWPRAKRGSYLERLMSMFGARGARRSNA